MKSLHEMRQRTIVRLLALVTLTFFLFWFIGCGGSSSNNGSNNNGNSGTTPGSSNPGDSGGTGGSGGTGSGGTGGNTGGGGGSASTASYVYFLSHFDTNLVNGFRVDNSNGALTTVDTAHPSHSGNWLTGLVGSVSTPYMHLLTYVPVGASGSNAIDTLVIDTSTGKMNPAGSLSPAAAGSATVNKSGTLLFVVSNTASGGVLVTYKVDSSGALNQIDSDNFGAYPYDVVLNSSEDRLYVSGFEGNNGPSHIVEFSVTGNGVVQQLRDVKNGSFSQLAVAGDVLFGVSAGPDHDIHSFRVGSGSITPLTTTSPAVDQPWISIDPTSKYLIVAGSKTAAVFSIGSGGVLTQVGSTYDIGSGGDAPPLFVKIGGTTYVYFSRFDKVHAFKLDSAGTLTSVAGSPL